MYCVIYKVVNQTTSCFSTYNQGVTLLPWVSVEQKKKKNQSVIKLLIKLFCTKLKSASNFWSVIQTTLSLLHMKMSKQEDLTKPEVKTF